jgi:putative endopeptidase
LVRKNLQFAASVAAVALVALGAAQAPAFAASTATATTTSSAAANPTRYGAWGFDLKGMDRSVRPGDDWFRFVNGTWAKNTQIPADRSSYGAFAVLRDLSEMRLRSLISGYSASDTAHPDRMKAALLYQGFMNEAAAEKLDAQPLVERLAPIRAAATKDDMARLMGRSIGGFGASFFGPGVNDDAKQPDIYALYLRQSGLGLGERVFYVNPKLKAQGAR